MRQWIKLFEEELVDEVMRVPPFSKNDNDQVQRNFLRAFEQHSPTKTGILDNGMELWTAVSLNENIYAFAVKDNEPVGYLKLEHVVNNEYQVDMVFVRNENRREYIAYYLYTAILKQGKIITTDDVQTPGGEYIWRKMASDPRIRVYSQNYDFDFDEDNIGEYYDDEHDSVFSAEWVGR